MIATMPYPCLREQGQATLITLHVAPNARRTEISGWFDDAVRVRLAAQPVDGRANDALARWLAQALDLPLQGVTLVHGASSRKKTWRLERPLSDVQAWLETWPALRAGASPP